MLYSLNVLMVQFIVLLAFKYTEYYASRLSYLCAKKTRKVVIICKWQRLFLLYKI